MVVQWRIQDVQDAGGVGGGGCQPIITARNRSLGEGNILKSVCDPFCSQGGGVVKWGCGERGRGDRGVVCPGSW